jgi:hypothetical protein
MEICYNLRKFEHIAPNSNRSIHYHNYIFTKINAADFTTNPYRDPNPIDCSHWKE